MLPIGARTAGFPTVDVAPVPDLPAELGAARARAGPRADWFAAGALDLLGSRPYQVTAASNRVGLRLSGPALRARRRPRAAERGPGPRAPCRSRRTASRSSFLADHPVTGGYPVIAVVDEAAVALAAQARPGDRIRFRLS